MEPRYKWLTVTGEAWIPQRMLAWLKPSGSLEQPLPSPNVPALPPEIVDIILEHLCPTDPDARLHCPQSTHDLSVCSLVNSTWHALVLRHLFRDFAFTYANRESEVASGSAQYALQPRRPRRPLTPHRTLPMLLAFLHHHPDIAKYIRRLRLEYYVGPGDMLMWTDGAVLLAVLQAVPQLRDLFLYNVMIVDPPRMDQPLCPPLRSLHLNYHDQLSYHPVADMNVGILLGCFTKVKELELVGSGNTMERILDSYDGPQLLDVGSLVLQRRGNGPILFRHLAYSRSNLTRLIVRLVEFKSGELDVFEEFLEVVATHLEEFRVYLQHDDRRCGVQSIDIKPCRNIQELTIGLTLPIFAIAQANRALEELYTILSVAHFSTEQYPRLTNLTLEITLDKFMFAAGTDIKADWVPQCVGLSAIDETLVAAVERCRLDGVNFECHASGKMDARASTKRLFPELHRKGRMRFGEARDAVWQSFA